MPRTKQYGKTHGPKPHLRWATHKRGAVKRGLIPLSKEEWLKVTRQPCVYGGKSEKDGIWVGVDRRDNTLGYPGNSMPSCWRHNVMRNCHFTFEEMQFIVANIESAKICGNHPPTAYNQSHITPE